MAEGLLGRLGGKKHASGKEFAVALGEEEWRRKLSPAQYRVLREHGTERAGLSPLDKEYGGGHLPLCRLRSAAFRLRHQIQQRNRLAEFLGAGRAGGRDTDRPQSLHGPHRSALQPLRRTSRPRL